MKWVVLAIALLGALIYWINSPAGHKFHDELDRERDNHTRMVSDDW